MRSSGTQPFSSRSVVGNFGCLPTLARLLPFRLSVQAARSLAWRAAFVLFVLGLCLATFQESLCLSLFFVRLFQVTSTFLFGCGLIRHSTILLMLIPLWRVFLLLTPLVRL